MKKNFRFIIIILLIIIIVMSSYIMSKYRSESLSETLIDIAYYVIDVGVQTNSLLIGEIKPQTEKYEYRISVSNSKNGKNAETSLEYTMQIKTTTNLPLIYDLYLEDDYNNKTLVTQIVTSELIRDTDGVYYKKMTTNQKEMPLGQKTDRYILTVEFPENFGTQSDYSNIAELLEITIDSKQKI